MQPEAFLQWGGFHFDVLPSQWLPATFFSKGKHFSTQVDLFLCDTLYHLGVSPHVACKQLLTVVGLRGVGMIYTV